MFITYKQTSEQSYLLNYGEDINIITNKKVISHFKYLIKNKFEYILNIVPSFNKLLIVFDTNFKQDVEILIQNLKIIEELDENNSIQHLISICYDEEYSLDYKNIENAFSIDFDEFINLHSSTIFNVFMIGFMPGLPFLGSLNINQSLPRLENPRISVPAGSVGVVDKLSVIYPNQSSGGWNLIGKTTFNLFNNWSASISSILGTLSILKPFNVESESEFIIRLNEIESI